MQRGYHALPNDERCFSAAKGWTRACLRWVKSGKAQNEQMLSALPPKADKEQTSRFVRFVPSSLSLKNLDPAFLMWDMRRNLKPTALPERRCTVEFIYPEVDRGRRYWWLVIEDGAVDLCGVDPGYDVDLHVRSSL